MKRMSWGVRIGILYGGFVLLIVFLVSGSMRQQYDLVSGDYYERELQYQQVIDAGKNQSLLREPVLFDTRGQELLVTFPEECAAAGISGTINFYAPVNKAWDRLVTVETNRQQVAVPLADLKAAGYVVKISWVSGGKEYYQESPLNLPRP